jgi:hypothetical protein
MRRYGLVFSVVDRRQERRGDAEEGEQHDRDGECDPKGHACKALL